MAGTTRSATTACRCSTGPRWIGPRQQPRWRCSLMRWNLSLDIHVLACTGTHKGIPTDLVTEIHGLAERWDEADAAHVEHAVLSGLPGVYRSEASDKLRGKLAFYQGIGPADMAANLITVMELAAPLVERLSIRLKIHPDDPPRPLFGLPPVVSNAGGLARICELDEASHQQLAAIARVKFACDTVNMRKAKMDRVRLQSFEFNTARYCPSSGHCRRTSPHTCPSFEHP